MAREKKVYLFSDDTGAIVTGTHDVALAESLLRDELQRKHGEEQGFEKWLGARAWKRTTEFGRIVPTNSDPDEEGYEVFWRREQARWFGRPGTTRAVVWRSW